jgi:hypothetical protein
MGDRLKADIGRIRDAADAVAGINDAFSSTESLVSSYGDEVGNETLADKLHEFATNWKVHRERLSEDLQKFSDWARQAADGYEQTDDDLAAVLTEGAKQ